MASVTATEHTVDNRFNIEPILRTENCHIILSWQMEGQLDATHHTEITPTSVLRSFDALCLNVVVMWETTPTLTTLIDQRSCNASRKLAGASRHYYVFVTCCFVLIVLSIYCCFYSTAFSIWMFYFVMWFYKLMSVVFYLSIMNISLLHDFFLHYMV